MLLRAAVAGRREELVDLLRTLVEIESHATQPDGVRRVGRIVAAELEGADCACTEAEWPPRPAADAWLRELMLPGGDYGAVAEAVLARRDGIGPSVLLLADLDTSYAAGTLARFPFRVENGRAYGPGTADMKGGLVVLVAALRALHDTGLEAPELTVVLSPDEQAGSLRSRGVIEEAAADADVCLCLECARDGGNLLSTRAQCGVARLDVSGREAHAGSAHGHGASAIRALALKVPALEALTDPKRGIFVTVGEIGGGRRRSVVPGAAWCTIDIRTPDADAWEEVERALRAIASREALPGTATTLRVASHRPALAAPAEPLVGVVRRAASALGLAVGDQPSAAGGSSAFPAGLGVPTLDGLGPPGGNLMTELEHVEIEGLVERSTLLALTLHLLAASPAAEPDVVVQSEERSMA